MMANPASQISSQQTSTALQDQSQRYAFTVAAHSRRSKEDSLYPGHNYKALADFLCRPYRRASSLSQQPTETPSAAHTFAISHCYTSGSKARILEFGSGTAAVTQFTEQDFATETSELLFIAGWPSPEWLNAVGSRYRIDPEYFRRHLDVMLSPCTFDLPSLPSSSKNIVQVPIITIGARSVTSILKRSELDSERKYADARVRRYLRDMDRTAEVGTSIVRRLQLIDQTYFACEQEISICVQRREGSWTAICWLDCGRDLTQSRFGPWAETPEQSRISQNTCLPVYLFYPKVALNFLPVKYEPDRADLSISYQSASSLPRYYGQNLVADVLRADAFYALTEVISFSAFSISQCLNLIESMIDRYISESAQEYTHLSLADLQYAKSTLDLYLKRLQSMLSFIKARGGPKWPRAVLHRHEEIAKDAAQNLHEDFEHLIERTRMLSTRCSDESRLLINKSMVDEAQRSLVQAKSVARLTWLAFFFIPISFTTSFFGMNVVELVDSDGARLSMWTWFVMSIPVLLIAIGASRWKDIHGLVKTLWNCLKRDVAI